MVAHTKRDLPTVTDDRDRLTDDLDRHGYCLVESLLSEPQRLDIRDTLRLISDGGGSPRENPPDTRPWTLHDGEEWLVLMIGEHRLDHLVLHPSALGLARHLLGEYFQLSGFSSHILHPGNEMMDLHTDQWWMPQPMMPGEKTIKSGDITRQHQPHGWPAAATRPINPAVVLNYMWAITAFTADNGATQVVPGSHLSGLHPDPTKAYDVVDAEVPAGGAVVWDARTWHGSGRNRGNAARIGITTTYCGPQFRQLRNFTCALPPTVQASLSDELRALLGFKLWESYGATDDDVAQFARPGYERRPAEPTPVPPKKDSDETERNRK